jgi:hypothetical protein
MRISITNLDRDPLGDAMVDEQAQPAQAKLRGTDRVIDLHWDGALDEKGRLHRCVVCGCREIFKRYDFPQRLGLGLVIASVILCVVLLIKGQVLWAMGVLLAAVVLDRIVYVFTKECLVCYRCRSEFRDLTIDESHDPWDLAIGEKYRPIRQAAEDSQSNHHPEAEILP